MKDYEAHPICVKYPTMDKGDFDRLKASLKKCKGKFFKIILYEGKVLDGWHRYTACKELGIDLKESDFEIYKGDSAEQLAYALNVPRRHLMAKQKAALIVMENPTVGSHDPTVKDKGGKFAASEKSDAAKAKAAGVSPATVKRVRRVERESPEKVAAILADEIEISEAIPEEKTAPKKKELSQLEQFKEDAKRLRELASDVHDAGAEVGRIIEKSEVAAYIHPQSVEAAVDQFKGAISQAQPFAICPYCKGKKCKECLNTGWIPKKIWTFLPKELK